MFKLTRNPALILRLADGALVPADERNADYQRFLAWQAEGNTPAAADPPPAPTQDEINTAAAKADAVLTALEAMTPTQAAAYVEANVTDFQSAKALLKKFAIVIAVLWKRTA